MYSSCCTAELWPYGGKAVHPPKGDSLKEQPGQPPALEARDFSCVRLHYIIDVGPDGGSKGGQIEFTGTPEEMIKNGDTITAKYLKK